MSIESGMRVVVMGGGTGNSTVLGGLSPYVGEGLTAVVNTFDDGGATGGLRNYYDDLPGVGDLRQCVRAMSQAPDDERELLDARFGGGNDESGVELKGQTLGNLILTAAMQQHGNFSSALGLVSRMYNVRGKVLPASEENRRLEFHLPDGQVIYGEHNAEETEIPSLQGTEIRFDKSPTDIHEETEAAISDAELVVLAPGDLYTSLAPVLAVRGMREALNRANGVIMVANLMNRNRHTVGFTAATYAEEYDRILGAKEGEHVIDRVIFNTDKLDEVARKAQASVGSYPVKANMAMLARAGYSAVGRNLLSREDVVLDPNDAIAATRSTIRHDPDRVARAIMREYYTNGFNDESGSMQEAR